MSHRPLVAVRRLLAAAMLLATLAALAPAGVAAQNDRGLIDETSYQSPQFGYPITWDAPWSVEDRDVITNPGGFDTITIRSDNGTVRISGRSDDYDAVTFLMDTIAIQLASGGELINQDTTSDTPWAELLVGPDRMRLEVVSLPEAGAIVLVSLRANEAAYDAAFTSAHDTIQLNGAAIFDTGAAPAAAESASAEEDTGAEAPAPADAAQVPAPTSTVEVLGGGVEGTTYTSPSFGFSVSWDGAVWTVPEDAEYSEPGYDSLQLIAPTGPVWISGWQAYDGNAATCLAGEQTYYNDPEAGISDWQVAVDANGVELTGTTDTSAWGVFTNVYTDPDNPSAPPVNYVDYIECVSLGDGESVVIFYTFAERDAYNDHIGNVLTLIESLELPAVVTTPTATATATATTPAQTPTTAATTPAQTPTTPTQTATTAAQTPTTTAGQPVTVGQTQVSWTGPWAYDAETSAPEQVSLLQTNEATGALWFATYGEFPNAPADTPDEALEGFATAFFDGAGATSQTELTGGTLPHGTAWKLYSFQLQGSTLNLLITASQNSAGVWVVSTVIGTVDGFPDVVAQAQQQILLNGQPTYMAGIDPAALTATTTTTPATAAQTPTGTATATATTPAPTPGGTPTSVSQGGTVTGQTYAYSFSYPPGWHVNESTQGGPIERTVMTNGVSNVTIEARAMTVPTLSDCVANVAGEHQSQPVYTDLELARTASGDPFSGEDEFSAFANFTFTGPDGEPWAHFVECRWIVQGESVLVVVQDVPEDQFGAERAARRQIQNTIEIGG
jgi:hypothetical protein